MNNKELCEFDTRIIVAGTRDYSDYETFSKVIADTVSNLSDNKIIFISGAAKSGADALIIRWCKENNYPCAEFPADWDKYKKSAGYIRNVEMSDVGTHLIAFWDGESNGTKHMIDIATEKKLSITVNLIELNKKAEFTFFYTAASPLSQHYPAKFTVNNIEFNCAEQFMMYCKAMLFGDKIIAQKILDNKNPQEQKMLGRQVKNFDERVWKAKRESYVFIGNLNKFRQNKHLKEFILNTKDTELVEASEKDTVWGIGLGLNDPKIYFRHLWRGMNLLGKTLGRVRTVLSEEN